MARALDGQPAIRSGIAAVLHVPLTSSLSLVITNRLTAGRTWRALVSHIGALFTPYTMLMFILGLWLGYLGAVDEYRACRQERDHGVAVNCPDWPWAE